MLPIILSGIGGYLLGSSADETKKFGEGGMNSETFDISVDPGDISIYKFEKYLGVEGVIDDVTASLKIKLSLHPEVKSWGISSIYISIDQIVGTISWETYIGDEEEGYEFTKEDIQRMKDKGGKVRKRSIEGEFEFIPKDWNIENELTFASDGGFMIQSVDISFDDKVITIQ